MDQVTKINIPTGAKNIVIFVHGFGVRWDSRGLFTQIQDSLPSDWGSVLFDFYKVDGNDIYVETIEDQVERLGSVISQIKEVSYGAKIHLIAHSKGCIVTAITKPYINGSVIFLSPPENFGTKMEDYFRRYPGATSDENEIVIPRKDSTITHIPVEFFKETAKIGAEEVMNKYANNQKISLLQTTEDEVIGKTSYKILRTNPNVEITQLASDHNFKNENRARLINYIYKTLNTEGV